MSKIIIDDIDNTITKIDEICILDKDYIFPWVYVKRYLLYEIF